MQQFAREHVPALTLVLSAVALGLVFGAVGGVLPAPPAVDPLVAAVPHLNAALSVAGFAAVADGWRRIRAGEVAAHRRRMVAGLAAFATFLALYLYRLAVVGTKEFPGPETVYTYVYLPVLGVHMLTAVVCVPLLVYVVLLAGTRSVPEIRRSLHPRVGRVAAALWLASFAGGVVVYLLLYRLF
jgi:putative membrane protein